MNMRPKRLFLPAGLGLVLVAIGATALAAGTAGAAPPEQTPAAATHADVVLLVMYVLLALIFSFMCSVAEAVLLSITPSYIAGLREARPGRFKLLKKLRQDDVDQSLAAILTLNTIAHTAGAIGAGAKATIVFGSAWFGVFSAVMTLMILLLSEIIPKTLGAVYWRRLAGATAVFVRSLILILYPLILVTEGLTNLIARGKRGQVFCRDEFVAMARIGEQAGQIAQRESVIIRNLFRLGVLRARDVMTPRTVIFALQQNLTVDQALAAYPDNPFSRVPLYGKDIDDITGFVLKDELLLTKALGRGDAPLGELRRNILAVAGEMPLSLLLEFLLDNRQHIVLVAGEFGGTGGLVTLEDVVETLLGMEIVDEMDKVEDMQTLARQQWVRRAKALGLEVDETDSGSG